MRSRAALDETGTTLIESAMLVKTMMRLWAYVLAAQLCGCATVEVADVATRPSVPAAAIVVPIATKKSHHAVQDVSLREVKVRYGENKKFLDEGKDERGRPFHGEPDLSLSERPNWQVWAPISELKDTEGYWQEYLELLASGQSTDSEPSTADDAVKEVYVAAELARHTTSERHLLLCEQTSVRDIVGPPLFCSTVAILEGATVWVPVHYDYGDDVQDVVVTGASIRAPTGLIEITFNVRTSAHPDLLLQSILDVLQNEFDLSAARRLGPNIEAVSTLRDSSVLPSGWREAIDLRAEVIEDENLTNHYWIGGNLRAMVCRQALDNIVNYHGLSGAQQHAYATAYDRGFEKAILSVGRNCRKRDARTILCD